MATDWTEQSQRVAREDLVLFINSCLACTGQREFYDDGYGQRVSIDFLHEYILTNYRLLYSRTLAAGVNHFNQAQIILKLLATGSSTVPAHRQEEGELIAAALRALPPNRAWDLLQQLRKRGINNRRSRAVAREYVRNRRDISFDAVKYRSKLRAVASHAHLTLPGELGAFLFRDWKKKSYQTELFENFRQAHYSADAIYKLPFTVAEGLANKHKIPRDVFLTGIQNQMTMAEKLRIQQSAQRSEVEIDVNLGRMPLTKLVLYILSLSIERRIERRDEFEDALKNSARATLRKSPLRLGKVAAVLDCSYSSSGSSEKRRRPLAVALGVHYLLQAATRQYRPFWTVPVEDPLCVLPRGQTNLATPILDALEWGADTVIIVSDGFENDPPTGASEVLRVFCTKLDPQLKVSIVHCNPVYNSDNFALRPLSQAIPTVGLRDAEDLPTMLGFANFARGTSTLNDLEAYLAKRVQDFLQATGGNSNTSATSRELERTS